MGRQLYDLGAAQDIRAAVCSCHKAAFAQGAVRTCFPHKEPAALVPASWTWIQAAELALCHPKAVYDVSSREQQCAQMSEADESVGCC